MDFRKQPYAVINIPCGKLETLLWPVADGDIKILESTVKKKMERFVLQKVKNEL